MAAVRAAADAVFDFVVPLARHRVGPGRASASAVLRVQRRQPAIAEHPLRRKPGEVGVVPVDVGAAALCIGEPHHLRRDFEERPVARLALAQGRFRAPAVGDVVEQDRDAVRSGLADPEGVDVVPAAERRRDVLEAHCFARQRDTAVDVEPMLLMVRRELAHPFAHRVGQARLAREGRVDLDESVVSRPLFAVEFHLDDAEAGVDRLEQRPVARLALTQHRRGCARLAQHRSGRPRLAQPQAGRHLGLDRAREVLERPLFGRGPGARPAVDAAERADDAPVRQRQGDGKISDDAQILDGRVAAHARVLARIAHRHRQPGLHDRAAERVGQRGLAQAGPGLGQALGAQEELPVGVQERDERHRYAEETAREPGEAIEPFLGGSTQQTRPVQRAEAPLGARSPVGPKPS